LRPARFEDIGIQFAAAGNELLPSHLMPMALMWSSMNGSSSSTTREAVDFGGKLTDEFFRQGISHAQFQEGSFRENFPGILIRDAGGDNTGRLRSPGSILLKGKSLAVSSQF